MYCNTCNKYRKFKKTKISYIFKKNFQCDPIYSIAYSRCGHEYEKIFKEEESIEILKILGLINNIEEYQKIYNNVQKSIAQESRLKKIDEIRNYLIEEINQHELISKKHKKVYRV